MFTVAEMTTKRTLKVVDFSAWCAGKGANKTGTFRLPFLYVVTAA